MAVYKSQKLQYVTAMQPLQQDKDNTSIKYLNCVAFQLTV